MPCRNIGIFAHVDAGKTTVSEQLLAYSGTIREAGSVDRGTAHTDDLPVERRRGISVFARRFRYRKKQRPKQLTMLLRVFSEFIHGTSGHQRGGPFAGGAHLINRIAF